MLCGKLNGPLSKSLHRLHTGALARAPVALGFPAWEATPSLKTTAAVQLLNPLQYPVGEFASAASKNGCGVTAAALAAQPPPARPVTPPQYCNTTFLYAWANCCPPSVIM